jgi:uncharacterized membrane protein YidH (DUF202 family)
MTGSFYTWILVNIPIFLLFLGLLMLITNTAKMGLESNEEKNKYYQSNVASIVLISVALLIEKLYVGNIINLK